jgi:predicted ATPase
VRDQIIAHTDGVPLFIEELTKTVLESGLLREADAIVLQIKVSRVNVPRCLIGLETGSDPHYIARQIKTLRHDVRLLPAQ